MSIYRVDDRIIDFRGLRSWVVGTPSGGGTPVGGITRNVYGYINSLYYHAIGDGNENTNVATWITRFAAAAPSPNVFVHGAEFGFFSQWETPPRINEVRSWGPLASVTRVGFVPDNFDGQSRDPSLGVGYAFDGLAYTPQLLTLVDAIEANAPNASRVYYVYAGSPSLAAHGGTNDDPATVTVTQFQNWVNYGLGAYSEWMALLVSQMQSARPGLTFRLHDVNGATLRVFRDTVVSTIPATSLFEDLAPHGRPTWYLLKAIAEYIELYNEKPPAGFSFDPVWGVHQTVVDNYQPIVDYIWGVLRP